MQFEIHTGDNIKACKLQDLSRRILVNSEVYIVEGEKKRLIGISFSKTIAYLSAEFADYALSNYTNLGELDALPTKNCINLVRKWIEDSSSVSEEELKAAARAAEAAASAAWATATWAARAAEARAAEARAAEAAAGAAAWAAVGATTGVAWAAENAALAAGASSSAIGSDKDARVKAEKNEFERQGIFILDFLKPEKTSS